MKPFLSLKTLTTSLFLLCLTFFQAWALNIIDIEETSFSRGKIHVRENGTKIQSPTQVRLVDFDVTKQRFVQILYIMTPKEDHYTYDYKGVTIGFQRDEKTNKLTISIEKAKPQKETWFVAPKQYFEKLDPTQVDLGVVSDEVRENRSFIRPKGEQLSPSTKEDLLKLFNTYQKRASKKSSPVQAEFVVCTEEPLSYDITGERNLFSFVGKNPHNTETGILGELASDLTFFAHGFTKKASKLSGNKNNGFDGVYFKDAQDPLQKQLWVVEAKFHDKSQSEKFFDGELYPKVSKGGALDKYKDSSDKSLVRVYNLIDDFLKTHPQQLIFLGYDIMSDGKVKTPFIRSYAAWFPSSIQLLTKSSPEKERDVFLKEAIGNYVLTSPKKEDPLVFAKRILEAAGITGIKIEKGI